nr:MAG TPA: hypothetical protein [Caudoviricetes sp.]
MPVSLISIHNYLKLPIYRERNSKFPTIGELWFIRNLIIFI